MDTLQASFAFEPETTRQGFVRFWEMMAPVCYRADEGHRDAIWKEVQEGRVWAFLHTDAGALACIEDRPTGTSDVCVFTYGGLADALDEVLGDVEAFARGRGCVGICIQADAKAGRGFAGFDPVSVCLRRDLA